jgi:3'-5' exoribonuclease 1
MYYIVVDLEATCWENSRNPARMEIIELGAVALASASGPILGEFAAFVRPVREPILSDFCKTLTSINQSDIDSAEVFSVVYGRWIEWIEEMTIGETFTWCSWGAYDLGQLHLDCQRHNIPFPEQLEQHINLKKAFSQRYNVGPHGMARALAYLKLPLVGTHHRAIDDTRNIAQLALRILAA